ncbi:MAG: alpha/beta hydrolase [Myxococcales bacterium]|nr:alpha/beta hydrolase [Myxococcales bacterium]
MIHVRIEGEGEPILFLHAGALSGRQWGGHWRSIGPYQRIVPDLWGCGRSPSWPGPWPFTITNDLVQVRRLLEEHGPCHVIGHSYGGCLGLMAAAEHPELVRTIAVYEPPLLGRTSLDPAMLERLAEDGPSEVWFQRFVDWWNGPGSWASLPEASRRSQLRCARECHGQVHDLLVEPWLPERFATVTAPALVMHGTASPPLVHAALDEVVSCLPNGRKLVIDGEGHLAPVMAAQLLVPHVRRHLTLG